jgi:hypothetical protein
MAMMNIIRLSTLVGLGVLLASNGACADDVAKDAMNANQGARSGQRTMNHAGLNLSPRRDDMAADLAAPLHNRSLREKTQIVPSGRDADLADGYSLKIGNPQRAKRLDASVEDFRTFMTVCMEIQHGQQAYPIVAEYGAPKGCPQDAPEAFHLAVGESECRITVRDAEGIRRALIYLEDQMTARHAPRLPLGEVSRWATVVDRIVRSPVAPYNFMTGWELEYEDDFYPDQYLNKLMHCGVNGIWVHGLLRRTVASKTLPELGKPSPQRVEKLRHLTERASRYGIKVYFFCMEPRPLPQNHPVFAAHPEIRGAGFGTYPGVPPNNCLCMSTKLVQDYLREAFSTLFAEVPELGGVITIFNAEAATTCWLNEGFVKTCSRCKNRPQNDVLAEDLNCHMDGIRRASPKGKLLAWTYLMDSTGLEAGPLEPLIDVMNRTHRDIIWLNNFEHGGKKQLCGKTIGIHEYSLSYTGPSEPVAKFAAEATRQGRQSYAKLQVGTTHETGSLPEVPVPGIVYDKLAGMRRAGIFGTVASWIEGGYPGIMLKALGEASMDPLPPKDAFLLRLAQLESEPEVAPQLVRAWNLFEETFQRYPFSNTIFYFGPIIRSPAYQLHLEREPRTAYQYNWGLDYHRHRQPFEDQVSRWLGPYTSEDLITSFRQMGQKWRQGVELLDECRRQYPDAVELNRRYAVAAAAGVQFRSTANVIEFYTLRDQVLKSPASKREAMVARLRQLVEDDIALAKEMKSYMAADAAIGFHNEMQDYSFSPELLDDKIGHARQTLETLVRWQQSGIEADVLTRSLPATEPTRPAPPSSELGDQDPLRWGD